MDVDVRDPVATTVARQVGGAREQAQVSHPLLDRASESEPVAESPKCSDGPGEKVENPGYGWRKDVVGRGRRPVAELMGASGRWGFARRKEDRLDPAAAELLALAPEEYVRLPRELRHQVSESKRGRHRRDSVTDHHECGEAIDTRYGMRLAWNRPHLPGRRPWLTNAPSFSPSAAPWESVFWQLRICRNRFAASCSTSAGSANTPGSGPRAPTYSCLPFRSALSYCSSTWGRSAIPVFSGYSIR